MVGKIRFELIHPEERDLQSPAPLQLRRLPLEQRAGFEPAVLRICNPLHWASLPPLRITHSLECV